MLLVVVLELVTGFFVVAEFRVVVVVVRVLVVGFLVVVVVLLVLEFRLGVGVGLVFVAARWLVLERVGVGVAFVVRFGVGVARFGVGVDFFLVGVAAGKSSVSALTISALPIKPKIEKAKTAAKIKILR